MAETSKLSESEAPPSEPTKMSSYRHCMDVILKLLSDFGKELKLEEAALKIEVNPSAVELSSSSETRIYSCLQAHITKLQAVSKSLRSLVEADGVTSVKENTLDKGVSSSSVKVQTAVLSEHQDHNSEAAESKTSDDDIMVQIRAGKSEIERRISAFMERKQMEINENNVREFCNVIDCNQENSCARTDAVFTPYPGFKSHVKVTRVVNTYGPQTRSGGCQGEAGEHQRGTTVKDCGNAAIEERLQNIETHLKLPSVGPVPLNIYQRLKKLEDRILELEGLSPEYFQSTSHLHKRPKMSRAQACSLTELDEKISAVKAALLKRMTEFGPRAIPWEIAGFASQSAPICGGARYFELDVVVGRANGGKDIVVDRRPVQGVPRLSHSDCWTWTPVTPTTQKGRRGYSVNNQFSFRNYTWTRVRPEDLTKPR